MIETLQNLFSTITTDETRTIDIGSATFPAYVFSKGYEYGVMIPYNNSQEIDEKFSLIHLRTTNVKVGSDIFRVLMLACRNILYRNEFASVCSDFVELGFDNNKRLSLLSNPYDWFEKWKNLMGNRKSDLKVYDVLGELKVLLYLINEGKSPKWNSIISGTHDIDADNSSYEVKSTIIKTDRIISVSSPYQLIGDAEKELYLVFCFFEKTDLGESIDDLSARIISAGFPNDELEDYIESIGYRQGKRERYEKYTLREMDLYLVDENFPKLTFKDFVEGKLPKGVLYYKYSIDLSGVSHLKIY
ncbi:MAG: PD-(D/E)XK motif protein [Firmicutes bacterium]|nr:PD-(D/E)XK motif protein [Bacillota bacterium]